MSSLHRDEDAVVRARNLNAWPMSAVAVMAGICSPRDPVCGGHTPADRGCITEYCELLSVRFEAAERIKGLRGAKPPQKPRWTDSVGFGGSTIRYGDFTADARCRGGLVRLSRRLEGVATALSPMSTAVSGWPASSLGTGSSADGTSGGPAY